ncbi:MAG: isochorismatase family protein [Planctomycetota bacterium]
MSEGRRRRLQHLCATTRKPDMSAPIECVVYTRDSHPVNHCSFRSQGGPWPDHCVVGTQGWEYHPRLTIVRDAVHLNKAMEVDRDSFSAFEETGLAQQLRHRNVRRCLVAGLATEYCVKATVLDALREGFDTWLVTDAIAAVNANAGDEERAILEMRGAGACLADSGRLSTIVGHHHRTTALLVVDAQNDFCPGGSLPVAEALRIFDPIELLCRLSQKPTLLSRMTGGH